MNDKVSVMSLVGHRVVLVLPHLRFKKVWTKKGAKFMIEKDILREAIYEAGVEKLFTSGVLYIEDMDFKIELGLEAEGTTKPTQIIPVDEKYLNRILKLMPIQEMKQAIGAMTEEQKRELVRFATEQKDAQMDRLSIVKELTGSDVFKMIEIKRQMEEE